MRSNVSVCPQDVKEWPYKELVHPVLENGSSVSDSKVYLFKKNLRRSGKGQLDLYQATTLMKLGNLEQIKLESLKKRRNTRHIILYKGLKGAMTLSPQLGMSGSITPC